MKKQVLVERLTEISQQMNSLCEELRKDQKGPDKFASWDGVIDHVNGLKGEIDTLVKYCQTKNH